MNKLRKELWDMKYKLGIIRKEECSKEESEEYRKLVKKGEPLPEGVYRYGEYYDFYRFIEANLTEDEAQELLLYKQVTYIKTIKNCALFFVVLAVISIISSIIGSIILMSALS